MKRAESDLKMQSMEWQLGGGVCGVVLGFFFLLFGVARCDVENSI